MNQLLILGVLLPVLAGDPSTDRVKEELKAFQGEWEVEWIETDGVRQEWRKGVLAFRGKQRLTRKYEEQEYKKGGSFEIDPAGDPKVIDLINGDDRKEGIYKIDGDTMYWCVYEGPGKQRPLEFRADAGSKNVLIRLTRFKAK
jgi:uncharacterized protein (TIGR03067 family)